MNKDLIERYIYAVTKRLPQKQRDDVAQELHGLIDDMLSERCDISPTDKDIHIVLTELGSPYELSVKYNNEADKCLIGQPYYSTYKFVLQVVLLAAVFGITVASLILQIIEPEGLAFAVGGWLSSLAISLLTAFGAVTLLFAFFQHRGIAIREEFQLSDLPPVPKITKEIPKWECVGSIILGVIFVAVFLFAPQLWGFTVDNNGTLIPIFNQTIIMETRYIILAFAACDIIRESVQLLEGQYNKRVLTVSLIANAVSTLLAVWWLTGFEIMNPAFLANVSSIFAGDGEIVIKMFTHFQGFFLGVMLFALIMDTAEVLYKTLRQ